MSKHADWGHEDNWWRQNFESRPYASGRSYEDLRPGYQYGFEAGQHHLGRTWNDVETDLRTGWDKFEQRGGSSWEHVKDAVRDAWHRITGQRDELEVDRMSGAGSSTRDT